MTFLIFESPPSIWRGEVPKPGNSAWDVAIFRVVGETEKRVIVEFAGGDVKKVPRDGQGRAYIDKSGLADAWQADDLTRVLAYREDVKQRWASTCAVKDTAAVPLFDQIKQLHVAIRGLEDVRDAAIDGIVAAVPRSTAEAVPNPPVAIEETVEPASEPSPAGPGPSPIQVAPPISATGDPQQQLCLL